MDATAKSTIEFCLSFITDNVDDISKHSQARMWINTAIDTIKKENEGSADFVISELSAIDAYFSGANSSLTSVDVHTKVDTVKQLL
jgi:hypothetical protein